MAVGIICECPNKVLNVYLLLRLYWFSLTVSTAQPDWSQRNRYSPVAANKLSARLLLMLFGHCFRPRHTALRTTPEGIYSHYIHKTTCCLWVYHLRFLFCSFLIYFPGECTHNFSVCAGIKIYCRIDWFAGQYEHPHIPDTLFESPLKRHSNINHHKSQHNLSYKCWG